MSRQLWRVPARSFPPLLSSKVNMLEAVACPSASTQECRAALLQRICVMRRKAALARGPCGLAALLWSMPLAWGVVLMGQLLRWKTNTRASSTPQRCF